MSKDFSMKKACSLSRPVVLGGAPHDFGRSVDPISTIGGRLCPPNDSTPGFSNPTKVHEISK